jgi:glyoxylase I family protein
MSSYVKGFHHVALKAKNFTKSMEFYTKGLGLKRAYGWGSGDSETALLDLGDGNYLELFAGGSEDAPDSPDGAYLHLALRSDDVDAALKNAVSAGARITAEPKDVPINGDRPLTFRIAFCKGPNGEIIEFFHNDEL